MQPLELLYGLSVITMMVHGLQEIVSDICPDHKFLPNVELTCEQFPYLATESVRTERTPYDIEVDGLNRPYIRVKTRNMINYRLNRTDTIKNEDWDYYVADSYVNVYSYQLDDFSDRTQFVEIQDPLSEEYVDKLVGIALDGIPIYTALGRGGYDMLNPSSIASLPESVRNNQDWREHGTEALKVDQCGGTYGPTPDGVRYHYRTIPACVLPSIITFSDSWVQWNTTEWLAWNRSTYDENVYGFEDRRKKYVTDIYDLLDFFETTPGQKSSQIIGWTTTGHPIYSPYNDRGLLHDDLDNCNGKFDANGRYGYYTTPTFPYIMGCNGPGVFNLEDEDSTLEFLPSVIGSNRRWNACPRGYIPSQEYASDGCQPCAAGRYSTRTYQRGVVRGENINDFRDADFFADTAGCNSVCPVGTYCPEGSSEPLKCPAGYYGSTMGLTTSSCSGVCEEGYFCPLGSKSKTVSVCGDHNVYCPVGSDHPLAVDVGFYTTPEGDNYQRVKSGQTKCGPGTYCVDGLRYPCPAGRYGTTTHLVHSNCTAICPVGHYCPESSSDPIKCPAGTYGAVEGLSTSDCSGLCLPGYYCPAASTNFKQEICRAGIYGAEYGLQTPECSPLCEVGGAPNATSSDGTKHCVPRHCARGYFCKEGSSSATQSRCGDARFYCPPHSAYPTAVDYGYYTIGDSSLPGDMQSEDDFYTRWSQKQCEPGFYCQEGVKYRCPKGHYGAYPGMANATCDGECYPGFICDEASPSPSQYPCGTDPSVYCPKGSNMSTVVPHGYYSVGDPSMGNTYTTMSAIMPCTGGTYCTDGVQYDCPAGRYSLTGSPTWECDGLCDAGYYCHAGSSDPKQYDCPAGRYGHPGEISSQCKGACIAGYYCPTNSVTPTAQECGDDYHYCPHESGAPIAVSSGYFSAGGNETTRTEQVQCVFDDYLGNPPAGAERVNFCPNNTVA